jgi:hypothetical protein
VDPGIANFAIPGALHKIFVESQVILYCILYTSPYMTQSASVKTLSCIKALAGGRVIVFLGASSEGAKSLSASTSASFVESRLMILAVSKASPSEEFTLLDPLPCAAMDILIFVSVLKKVMEKVSQEFCIRFF